MYTPIFTKEVNEHILKTMDEIGSRILPHTMAELFQMLINSYPHMPVKRLNDKMTEWLKNMNATMDKEGNITYINVFTNEPHFVRR